MVESGQDPSGGLRDKVAIVTGGGWNIGRAIALRLASRGARVVVASRRAERLAAVVDEIERAGGNALAVACDVTQLDSVEDLVARSVERFGTVDAMVACAGGSGAHLPIDEVDPKSWCHVVATNLFGTFHCARAVLPTFRRQDRGDIVTFTGGGAFFPCLGQHATAYATAKAAVCRFTDQLQAELLDTGIRVNCIEPGMVWNPDTLAAIAAEEERTGVRHPDRDRNRSPELAAELVEFLLTDAGATVRARILSVNDTWWRDPARVAAIEPDLAAYRLRRSEPS